MIRTLGTIFVGLLGLAFGSFLNVCLSRWPAGESVVQPRSHCRQCGRTLTWWENVPLVSWIALRGRCRTCRAWIGWRYPMVELAVGVMWALAAWHWVPGFLEQGDPVVFILYYSVNMVGTMLFSWLLVALAALDAEQYWLPNWITLPGVGFGLLLVIAKSALNTVSPLHDTVYGSELKMITVEAGYAALDCVKAILVAAALILLIRWVYWLIRRREGIGLGDAKLMAMLGAWLGLPGALLAFGLGVVLGALVALALLVVPSAKLDASAWGLKKLPLGTFLCIGGIVSSLWGQPIIAAYQRWAGF
jgi:leader peptidase (prepilin peptidase)/N-methyltransferase